MKRNFLFWMLITVATGAIADEGKAETDDVQAGSRTAQEICTQEGSAMGYSDEDLAEFVSNCVTDHKPSQDGEPEKEQG